MSRSTLTKQSFRLREFLYSELHRIKPPIFDVFEQTSHFLFIFLCSRSCTGGTDNDKHENEVDLFEAIDQKVSQCSFVITRKTKGLNAFPITLIYILDY